MTKAQCSYAGNSTKNLDKHGVSSDEAESVFYQPETIRVLGEQVSPNVNEPRYGLFGLTITGRPVFICFNLRGSGVRIISVRELNKNERVVYDNLRQD